MDSGDEIDCTRMGSGGYGIPSIVEPERIPMSGRIAYTSGKHDRNRIGS